MKQLGYFGLLFCFLFYGTVCFTDKKSSFNKGALGKEPFDRVTLFRHRMLLCLLFIVVGVIGVAKNGTADR